MNNSPENNSELDIEFNECVVKYIKLINLNLNDKLHMYGLYKQATLGNINTLIPSLFDVHNRKKWESWNYFKGIDSNSAKRKYIDYYKYLVDINQ